MRQTKANNEFDPFLNECQTYVWEWYIPEHKVRFGIPSLNSLWESDYDSNIKLSTMLERVHPDDIEKIFVRPNSPIYRSDKMFEVDLRLNVADVLVPGGKSSGEYEWFGFRGKIVRRDDSGKPVYLRGIAININHRVKVQAKFIATKERQIQSQRQHNKYCMGVMQEFNAFLSNVASRANSLITDDISREERLMIMNRLKEQGTRLMELVDRAQRVAGDGTLDENMHLQTIQLWEHMAELQQVYALRYPEGRKVYFSNLYDSVEMSVDVKMLDMLLENVVHCQMRSTQTGYLTLTYQVLDDELIQFSVTCTESVAQLGNLEMVLTDGGMSLSLCRLLAKRLFGDVEVRLTDDRRLHYIITLPLNAAQAASKTSAMSDSGAVDSFDDDFLSDGQARAEMSLDENATPVSVLVGSNSTMSIFRHQHLFRVEVAESTDDVLSVFEQSDPDIVFIDYNLSGKMQIDQAIERMHTLHPETPIVVTAQYATRPLHHRVRQDGARYLLNNPLSLRKVNLMINKYLK
ncbi:MAG: response regulator [Bacteroidales bacterium]|jgi:CheY-like chemotaxis protein|nr:response regulator [Bacteroidales bacterium]